jgi:hypothetical protein
MVIYDSSLINKFEASVTNGARFIINDCHMFIYSTGHWYYSILFNCDR